MMYRFIKKIENKWLILLLTLSVSSLCSFLPVQAHVCNSNVSRIGSTRSYTVSDPDRLKEIKVINDVTGVTEQDPKPPGNPTSYTITLDTLSHGHTFKITDCESCTDTWKIAASTGAPSKVTKSQRMTFIAPFNLSELTIPGTVTFNLSKENMISHSLILVVPETYGGANATLDFISGYGEIFFNYSAYDPYMIIFNITQWVMKYSDFPVLGRSTGQNTAVTDPTSYGTLNVTSGEMNVFETGTYTNDIYTLNCPINFLITYSGFANFTSNIIYLDGTGYAAFPAPPVGGLVVPVDKFGLLAPYIGLASTILGVTVATAIYVKRSKRRKEKL